MLLVPGEGFEPSRLSAGILSPLCKPVPPPGLECEQASIEGLQKQAGPLFLAFSFLIEPKARTIF